MIAQKSPYAGRAAGTFWSKGVGRVPPSDFDPIIAPIDPIRSTDKVISLGSCFAQHISGFLASQGFNSLVTEAGPSSAAAIDEGFGIYPARTGNIYTVRQLLQLFDRAFGLFSPTQEVWQLQNGRVIDPLRPGVQPSGFSDVGALQRDQVSHLAAVRRMFEEADRFIFTLGMTEAWERESDGAIVPLAPGVIGSAPDSAGYRFVNFSVGSMFADMSEFIGKVRFLNSSIKIILTVSPVPLAATYENRHVVVSTNLSKSRLRVLADDLISAFAGIEYFPSYDIIAGSHSRGRYFDDSLRSVTPEGVAHVMKVFGAHYLTDARPMGPDLAETVQSASLSSEARNRLDALSAVSCDEAELDP